MQRIVFSVTTDDGANLGELEAAARELFEQAGAVSVAAKRVEQMPDGAKADLVTPQPPRLYETKLYHAEVPCPGGELRDVQLAEQEWCVFSLLFSSRQVYRGADVFLQVLRRSWPERFGARDSARSAYGKLHAKLKGTLWGLAKRRAHYGFQLDLDRLVAAGEIKPLGRGR